MGWTEYRANHFCNGVIDRKKECDDYFEAGLNHDHYKVVKSRMVGSTYYGAVTALKRPIRDEKDDMVKDINGHYIYENIPKNERTVFGIVMLMIYVHS